METVSTSDLLLLAAQNSIFVHELTGKFTKRSLVLFVFVVNGRQNR